MVSAEQTARSEVPGTSNPRPTWFIVAPDSGMNLDLQAGQRDAFVVAQGSCHRDRFDGREVVPVVHVDDVRLAPAEVLERVG